MPSPNSHALPSDKPVGSAPRYTACVLVASTRAAAGEYTDQTGPVLVDWLRTRGFDTPDPLVVADRDTAASIDRLLNPQSSDQPLTPPDVLITTGGTGLTSDDLTVDAVQPHLRRELPGIVQAFFARGLESVPTAVLSRAVAGTTAHNTFVMTLPGSRGAVKDGISVLDPIIEHIMTMIHRPERTQA